MAKPTQIEFPRLDALQSTIDALTPEERAQISAERGEGVEILHVPAALAARVRQVASAPPDMAALRAKAMAQVIAYADSITARITQDYPSEERAAWTAKESEARAVLAGETLPAYAMLPGPAEEAGKTLTEFAAGVVAKADAYRTIVVAVEILRMQMSTALAGAATPSAVTDVMDTLVSRAVALGLAAGDQ
jgi:hypothetical protein